jgi:RNA polymerase sigma-70 factor (ECF subfamily)
MDFLIAVRAADGHTGLSIQTRRLDPGEKKAKKRGSTAAGFRPYLEGRQMAESPDRRWEYYRTLLQVQARQLQLSPKLQRRFDSSDLVHEALARAQANLADFRGTTEAELFGWLQEILRHVLVDELRKNHARKRDIDLERSLERMLAQSTARLEAYAADRRYPSPSEDAERRELLARVAQAIEQLPKDQRDVVILRDLMETPVAEIAERLQRTEKSVAGLLLRGRSRLRELLADLQ